MNTTSTRRAASFFKSVRIVGWSTIVALVALPAIAMQFTDEVNWTAEDFLIAAVMLGGVGLAFELAVRASGSWAYRAGAAVALGAGLLMLWANGAVGIIGNEDELINLWFNLIPLLAIFGAIGARFRPRGMAAAMAATAAAQVAVAVIAFAYGHSVWLFTLVWTGGWLLSAWLFRSAAEQNQAQGEPT